MSKLTVNTTASAGPTGVAAAAYSDPGESMPFLKIVREIDFSKQSFAENKNYKFMPIPKGFFATHIAVEQLEATDSDVTVTFATENDPTTAIGGNFALKDLSGETELCRSVQPATKSAAYAASTSAGSPTTAISIPGGFLAAADDTLCLCVPDDVSGDAIKAGKIRVALLGYMVFDESADFGNGTAPMRKGTASGLDNTASPDYDD